MCLYLYIHNKYTQYTHCLQKLFLGMQLTTNCFLSHQQQQMMGRTQINPHVQIIYCPHPLRTALLSLPVSVSL